MRRTSTSSAHTALAAVERPEPDLRELIALSLADQRATARATLIDEITNQFAQLDRGSLSRLDDGFGLVELKYALSDWRCRTARTLLAGLANPHRVKFLAAMRDLAKLSFVLDPQQTRRLISQARTISSGRDWMSVIAGWLRQFGDEDITEDFLTQESLTDQQVRFGFDRRKGRRIKAYYPIRGKLRNWTTHPSASGYEISADGTIQYRGLRLRAGDLVIADLNLNHEGLYTSFVSPRSYATHSAMVLLLEVAGRNVPAMLEIHKKGARVVPLSRFCASDFSTYLEAYRIDGLERHTNASELARIVERMLENEQLVYDFRGRPAPHDGVLAEGEPFVTCTTLLELVLRRAGVPTEFLSSTLNPGARANLSIMGLEVPDEAFLPTDIARSEGLSFVGVLDNNRLRQNLIREAVMGHETLPESLAHAFATKRLQKEALPIRHLLEEIVIHGAQNSNLVARIGGFDNSQQIPSSAPVGMLALLMMANTMVAAGIKELNQSSSFDFIMRDAGSTPFSLSEFETMPAVRQEIRQSFERNKVNSILKA